MPGEFDPVEEMGLFPDRIFVTNLRGFLIMNNYVRDLCARFIRNGAHLYDVLVRYDELTAYVLGREEATAGDSLKWVVPFLKANGATDHLVNRFGREDMRLMPGAGEAIRYITNLMPSFINTSMYEHGTMEAADALGNPLCDFLGSKMDLDHVQFGRAEARKVREMCEEISSLRIPKVEYELNVPMEVDEADVRIIKTLDTILRERIPELSAMSLMESVTAVTSHKKAYQLLDIRRQTNIDLDATLYIGGDNTDFQAMDLVRDSGGVSIAFNGTDFAVRGSTVAILSKDATVGAVFAGQFYSRGIEAVLELANNWDRKYIKEAEFPDENVVDRMLAAHPRKLPEVYVVDRRNVDEVAARSAQYRKKLLGARRRDREGAWCSGRDSNPSVGLERAE